jgi:hypothetical protein
MSQKHTLILADDPLGPSHPAVQTVCCVLGPGKVVPFSSAIRLALYDRIVICATPANGQKVVEFTQANLNQFSGRPVALISFAKAGQSSDWMEEVKQILGKLVTHSLAAAPEDAPDELINLALSFRAGDHIPSGEMPGQDLKKLVEAFLLEHNTLSLSTQYDGRVRATPLEYRYKGDGKLFCLSEGGEKFAGLLANGKVALAIFDPYRGFERLSGMQISGTAHVPAFGSPEHLQVLTSWGMTLEKMNSLPSFLHGIVIQIEEVVFLSSGLIRMGWRPRQVYRFEPESKTVR